MERERGAGGSLGPAYGLVTATPCSAIYLLEGIFFSPSSLLSSVLSVKTLNMLVG
jgi:hypothetical protein